MRILQLISLILFTYTSKAQSEPCTTDDKKFEIFGKEAKRVLTVKSLNSGNNMLSGVESAQSTGVGNAQSPSFGNAQSPSMGNPMAPSMGNPIAPSMDMAPSMGNPIDPSVGAPPASMLNAQSQSVGAPPVKRIVNPEYAQPPSMKPLSPPMGNAQSQGVGNGPPASRMVNPQYGSVVLEGKTGAESQQWRWRHCGDNHFIVSVATGGLLKLSKKEGQAPKLVTEPIGSNWNYDEATGQLREVKFGKLSRSMRLGIRKLKN